MHWNVAFCPTFTSTFCSRRKWGAFPKRETKEHIRMRFSSLHHFPVGGWQLRMGTGQGGIGTWEVVQLSEEFTDRLLWVWHCSNFTRSISLKPHKNPWRGQYYHFTDQKIKALRVYIIIWHRHTSRGWGNQDVNLDLCVLLLAAMQCCSVKLAHTCLEYTQIDHSSGAGIAQKVKLWHWKKKNWGAGGV